MTKQVKKANETKPTMIGQLDFEKLTVGMLRAMINGRSEKAQRFTVALAEELSEHTYELFVNFGGTTKNGNFPKFLLGSACLKSVQSGKAGDRIKNAAELVQRAYAGYGDHATKYRLGEAIIVPGVATNGGTAEAPVADVDYLADIDC